MITQEQKEAPKGSIIMSQDEYNAARSEYLTASALKDFIEDPAIYHARQTGAMPYKASPAFDIGNAAHKLILESQEAFEACYLIDGPINKTTGKPYKRDTKAFDKWCVENGFLSDHVLSETDYESVVKMADSVKNHPIASLLLSDGWPELTFRSSVDNLDAQCRIDWLAPGDDGYTIVDLKKTGRGLDRFEYDLWKFKYPYQLAFYELVSSIEITDFAIIAVESVAPFRTGVFCMGAETFKKARSTVSNALDELSECIASDLWPSKFNQAVAF
jgi:hypothetical protein